MYKFHLANEFKGKGKFLPRTGHEDPGGRVEVYRYFFFNLGSRWGVSGQPYAPAALNP
jgi:hypothetical protein